MGYAMQNTALVERFRLTGRFVKGKGFVPGHSPVDFVGDIKVGDRFIPVRCDAKSFTGDAWKFSDWNPATKRNKFHQVVALRHMARFGGVAFVLVQQSQLKAAEGTYGFPAWLVPLDVVEGCIRKGQWSMSVAELDARTDLPESGRTTRIKGADWLTAAKGLT
jgi:hypothetical protein